VGGDEVDFLRGVRNVLAAAVFHSVAAFGVALGGFDLDAPEAVSSVDEEVVAVAVSPGRGDGESEGAGAGKEGRFGGFSIALPGAALAGSLGAGLDGDGKGFFGLRLWRRLVVSD
jgi:hypothetical protein